MITNEINTQQKLMSELRFMKGAGFVRRDVKTDLASMVSSCDPKFRNECYLPMKMDMSYQDLRYLPEVGAKLTYDEVKIIHWEFPNFSTLEIDQESLSNLILTVQGKSIPLGTTSYLPVGYFANKSDGEAYMLFSFFANQWYTLAHFRRQVLFLGPGRRVGHVEYVRGVFVSTTYNGQVYHEGKWVDVLLKPLYNLPSLIHGHKEGVIMELDGIEYRVKNVKTHDLLVTRIDHDAVKLQTNDSKKGFRYDPPSFQVQKGDIVEVAMGRIIRMRDDKRCAEMIESYERIERSLLLGPLVKQIYQIGTDEIALQREQIFVKHRLIKDRRLMDALESNGSVMVIQKMFPDYDCRDVVQTMGAMGCILESNRYVRPRILTYHKYVDIYHDLLTVFPKEEIIVLTDDIHRECPRLPGQQFLFKASDLEQIHAQEDEIISAAVSQETEDFITDSSVDTMLYTTAEYVRNADPRVVNFHTKRCLVSVLKYSSETCAACMYNEAVRKLVDYVGGYAERMFQRSATDENIQFGVVKVGDSWLYRRNTNSMCPTGKQVDRFRRNCITSIGGGHLNNFPLSRPVGEGDYVKVDDEVENVIHARVRKKKN